MNSDAFFTIGTSHAICQDYALAGKTKQGKAFAVVADGCSSSAHTDIGARLIAASAVSCAENSVLSPTVVYAIARDSLPGIFSSSALDATLLFAIETLSGVAVEMYGDGFVLARRRDGIIEVASNDFNNAPPYLSYLLDDSRMREYLKYVGGKYVRSVTEITGNILDEQRGKIDQVELAAANPTIAQFSNWAYYSLFYPNEQYDLVMLASDGLGTFVTSDGSHVAAEQLAGELTSVKTFTGEFMTRRAKRCLQQMQSKGIHHYDDLAFAAIYLGE